MRLAHFFSLILSFKSGTNQKRARWHRKESNPPLSLLALYLDHYITRVIVYGPHILLSLILFFQSRTNLLVFLLIIIILTYYSFLQIWKQPKRARSMHRNQSWPFRLQTLLILCLDHSTTRTIAEGLFFFSH